MPKSLYDYCVEHDDFLLLVQWDKEKNGDLTAKNVPYASHRKIWWHCAFNHIWETTVYSRTVSGTGCPYCSGRKLIPEAKTLKSVYPELMKQWHPTLNIGISPEEVPPGSHRKVWWKCANGHEWKAQIKSRVNGAGCPICSNRKVLPGENDLATTYPEIAAQWHTKKNGTRTPQAVGSGHYAKVWWQCEKGHEWQATVLSRTSKQYGCPICAGKVVVPGVNDLASASPTIAAQWHSAKNGTLTPEQVTSSSNRKVWWSCQKGHEYSAVVAQRVHRNYGCPYCSNRKVLVGFNDLATIEPKVAAQWHPDLNENLTPQMVTAGSAKKVWWQCSEGHIWRAVIHSRAGSQKCGCPVCAGQIKASKQIRNKDIIAERLRNKK